MTRTAEFDQLRLYQGSPLAPEQRGMGIEVRVRARTCLTIHPNPDAIAYAFVEAARAFPGDLAVLRPAAEGVLKGRFAIRSRWIAAAALREVYGAGAMHFLLKGWNDERSMGRVLSGQRRQGWWDADLEKRLVAALRFRFGG